MTGKIVSQKAAVRIAAGVRERGKKIVFTNGCFDIVHSGHAIYLEAAGKLGDFLVVGLNSDASVRRLKGENRPIMKFRDRALLLSHLAGVDLVVSFGDDTPLRLIKKIRPDILVKGADYEIPAIVGSKEVLGWGGKVVRVPLVKGKSTSELVRRIKMVFSAPLAGGRK